MPQGAADKGVALEALIKDLACARAIFVGDDVTDEDVFLRNNPAVLGIRVGENPESSARYYLQGQGEMVPLLREMIAYLNESGG